MDATATGKVDIGDVGPFSAAVAPDKSLPPTSLGR